MEDLLPGEIVQKYKKAAINSVMFIDDKHERMNAENIYDLVCCMAITVAIMRARYLQLGSEYNKLRKEKQTKEALRVSERDV